MSEDNIVVCPNCGAAIMTADTFCDRCGASLSHLPGLPPIVEGIPGSFIVASSGIVLPLPQGKDELIIGRSDMNTGTLPDVDTAPFNGESAGVSRRHARLFTLGNKVYIEDLGSTNLTYVNSQPVPTGQRMSLRSGDQVRLGRLVLIYSLE
jgi:hypothetical protein